MQQFFLPLSNIEQIAARAFRFGAVASWRSLSKAG